MIYYKSGDISRSNAEAIVNTVNCVGIMGRGVALQIKKVFPENFKAYEIACGRGEVQPGKMFVFETGTFVNPKYIINFPTKRHWRNKSRMEDIESGLDTLVSTIRFHKKFVQSPSRHSEVATAVSVGMRFVPALKSLCASSQICR